MNKRWGQIADNLAIFYQIIFAPFLWIVLLGHAFCQIRKTPKNLEVSEITNWPSQITASKKASLIRARNEIVNSYLDLLQGKSFKLPDGKYCDDQVEWQDPLEKLVGRHELKAFANIWSVMARGLNVEKTVHGEHHSANGIVLDLTLTGQLKAFPSLQLPMKIRTYLKLNPDEKVLSITEHWGYNPLLDESTVEILHCPFLSRMLGKMHVNQRRLCGFMMTAMQRVCMGTARMASQKKN